MRDVEAVVLAGVEAQYRSLLFYCRPVGGRPPLVAVGEAAFGFAPHLRLKLLDVPFAYAQFGGGPVIREFALQSPPDDDFDE